METETKKKERTQITCNLSGEAVRLTEAQLLKQLDYYETKELLEKFFIKRNLVSMIKKGHSILEISKINGFQYNEEKKDYYNELITFHVQRKNSRKKNEVTESKTTQMETDKEVKNFISKWQRQKA